MKGIAIQLVCAAIGAAIAGPADVRAQVPDAATIRAAGDSAIARGDWKALAEVYRPVTAASPQNGMAWFRFGVALHELRRYDEAVAALRHAVDLKFQPAQAELRLARSFARLGLRDSSVLHAIRAADAGVAVELLTTERDFAALATDARFSALIARFEAAAYPCRALPEAHQFDFWLGDWNVTQWNSIAPVLARRAENVVTAELEHCVIHEHWTSSTGAKGESINFWDPNRKAWRQVWMDAHEWSLDYEGEYKDGAMRFHGWTLGPDGQQRLEKLTFFNISRDTVRQLFEQSADSGKTWQPTFDGRYVRIRGGAKTMP